MSPPKLYSTEAIILKKGELRETDSILTLYTPHLGKFKAVAKGVCRPESKLRGHVEPLTHSKLLLARSQNLDIVTQGQTIHSFLPLHNELGRISYALYAAELVDRFTPEGEGDYPIFELLLNTLNWLCQPDEGQIPLRYFELHLLEHLGYRPQLQRCVSCNSPLRPTTNFFSLSGGGAVCSRCHDQEPVKIPLSLNALKVLRFLQRNEYSIVSRLRVSPELSLELEQILQSYIKYLLEQEVKSVRWINRLKGEIEVYHQRLPK
jgi:DNA repair protein RecO (recombination protein O)